MCVRQRNCKFYWKVALYDLQDGTFDGDVHAARFLSDVACHSIEEVPSSCDESAFVCNPESSSSDESGSEESEEEL